jgi:branched-chain amino acid transport system permease protein
VSDPPAIDETAAPPVAHPGPAPAHARRRDPTRLVRPAAWTVVLLVLLALPLYLGPGLLSAGQYVMVGAVGAIGLTLVTGQAGQLSLAHAFFLLVGATTYAVLAGTNDDSGAQAIIGFDLPPAVALLGAILVPALLGLAFAPVAGRLKGIYLGIASLGLVFLGFYLGQALGPLTGGASTGRSPAEFSLFGFVFGNEGTVVLFDVPLRRAERLWYLFLIFVVIAYLLAAGAARSRVGRAWRAVRDNETAAAVMGVGVLRTKAVAFAVSAGYAGLAGVMTVLWLGLLKPDESEFGTYGVDASIAFLAMIIIGGLGSVPGAVIGALVVYGTPQFLTVLADQLGMGDALSGFSPVVVSLYVYGLAVILIMMFEPGGLAAIGRRLVAAARRGRGGEDGDRTRAAATESRPARTGEDG